MQISQQTIMRALLLEKKTRVCYLLWIAPHSKRFSHSKTRSNNPWLLCSLTVRSFSWFGHFFAIVHKTHQGMQSRLRVEKDVIFLFILAQVVTVSFNI